MLLSSEVYGYVADSLATIIIIFYDSHVNNNINNNNNFNIGSGSHEVKFKLNQT